MTLVLCLTLLRSVGHTLVSEGKDSPILRAAMDSTWPTKSESPIFKYFITKFRNDVVKEYRSPVKWVSHHTPDDNRTWTDYPITSGHYKDRDVRDVIQEAIDWWEEYFVALEASMAGS